MVDVPRFEQEHHLRAIVPEWLTRPPEVELALREQREHAAAEARRVALAERQERKGALVAVTLFALAAELFFRGAALGPLAVALASGLALGLAAHRLGETSFVWAGIAGLLVGSAAVRAGEGIVTLIVAVSAAAFLGAVVGVSRDAAFRA